MEKKIKSILRIMISCFYILYNNNTKNRFQYYKNIIYSYWISNSFAKCGKDILIQSPAYIKGAQYITVGECFSSLEKLRLECWDKYSHDKFTPRLIIGNNVVMNYNVHIGCIDMIKIGDNVLFGSNILITDHQHGYVDKRDIGIVPTKRSLSSSGPVIIEDDVWIGENVAIMPNVTIGKGCIIGANSVVTKSFSENSIIAGVPAKLIKTLNLEQ